ncbi:MAG: NAD(P)/FAD-dependent oxidoreductase [Nitrospiraceae bacterium]|nr:NAD(P)/FAD-dependent oxidoreductase [Nitrospiraceae bacterium]
MGSPHIVIAGGGFAGFAAAGSLRGSDVQVTLIDTRNYFLFQPLLYQVASGDLHAEAVATPIRRILRGKNQRFLLGTLTGFDFDRNRVLLEDGTEVSYDRLIVSLGSTTKFAESKNLEKNAWHLKGIPEAENLRSRILLALERASSCPDPKETDSWLTFVIVGGGPTGVEFTCGLLELFRVLVPRDYPEISYGKIKVCLLQGGDSLLPDFPPSLQGYAKQRVESLGGVVRFHTHVMDYDGMKISLSSGETVLARTLVWAAGVSAPFLASRLPGEKDPSGRVWVNDRLQIPGHPEIYVLGDMARTKDGVSPQVAPFAIQTGQYAAQMILASFNLSPVPPPFLYRNPGNMVVLGRYDAICYFPWRKVMCRGPGAWILWLGLHLAKILGPRNRLLALVDWGQDYLFRSATMEIIRSFQTSDISQNNGGGKELAKDPE